MPATGKSTKRKHTSLSSTSTRQHSSPAPSSSPDPPLRISLSYGPLSDNHASIAGMLPTRALGVIKEEIRQLCTQLAPAQPHRGLPHKVGHLETATLRLCFGFGRDRTNAGRWYSRCETCKLKPKTHIQFKTLPLAHDDFERLQILFDIYDEIKAHPRSSATSSPTKPPKKRRRIAETVDSGEIFDIGCSLTLSIDTGDLIIEEVLYPRDDFYFHLSDYRLLLEKQNFDYGRAIEFYNYNIGAWIPYQYDGKHRVSDGAFLQIRYAD